MREVEAKAWVDDVEGVRTRLSGLAGPARRVVKADTYFAPEGADPAQVDVDKDRVVRIREAGGKVVLTAKERTYRGGVEVSDEVELEVSDAGAMRRVLARLGFAPFLEKRKETEVFRLGETLLELSRVPPLGTFLEIEVLVPDDAPPAALSAAMSEVMGRFSELGLAQDRMESRPYAQLLREAGAAR